MLCEASTVKAELVLLQWYSIETTFSFIAPLITSIIVIPPVLLGTFTHMYMHTSAILIAGPRRLSILYSLCLSLCHAQTEGSTALAHHAGATLSD